MDLYNMLISSNYQQLTRPDGSGWSMLPDVAQCLTNYSAVAVGKKGESDDGCHEQCHGHSRGIKQGDTPGRLNGSRWRIGDFPPLSQTIVSYIMYTVNAVRETIASPAHLPCSTPPAPSSTMEPPSAKRPAITSSSVSLLFWPGGSIPPDNYVFQLSGDL